MNSNILIWFKNLAEGWKIALALGGMITFVAVTAVKIDHWKDKGVDQGNVIEHLQKAEHDQKMYNRMKDSTEIVWKADLMKQLGFLSDSISMALLRQQTLTNAVGTIGSKVTNTVPELFKLMGGLEFELVQSEVMKSVFPETKIKIIKSDSIRKK